MKRVRFLTPSKAESLTTMNESDCHSPRPFVHRNHDAKESELPCVFTHDVSYSPDPVKRFEYSDTSPYPTVHKTEVVRRFDTGNHWSLCSDLELSMLDSSSQQPRKPVYFTPVANGPSPGNICSSLSRPAHSQPESPINVLSPIENRTNITPPNILHKDDNFFITRGGLNRFQLQDTVQVQMNKMTLGKENCYNVITRVPVNKGPKVSRQLANADLDNSCSCHHCNKTQTCTNFNTSTPGNVGPHTQNYEHQRDANFPNISQQTPVEPNCQCMCSRERQTSNARKESISPKHPNAVDKKAWIIERYEQAKNQCSDVEKQMNVSKEKREPTVADLLKIIKLQNEQLQLLQEKVDKLISTASCAPQMPIQNIVTEHVAMETIDRDQHKISIGVMTSLEMVRTSTVINKEMVKQTYDNAQIQCNHAEINIKEVVKQPVNLNFLDGILPVGNKEQRRHESPELVSNCNDEKTLNEQSLYNVQVDNATTPLMSPEQSLYLDVRDYSGSDSGSDHSNVGWTYYNKVMTHVNGMLQDSDMPSSASALYRNTRQCLQMQIDKTNISVTKRVTFGDEPASQSADTSLRMNQLAAKYLKSAPAQSRQNEMSFATRNYMERHKILQGQSSSRRTPQADIPRFLDITTLKQQPKLL